MCRIFCFIAVWLLSTTAFADEMATRYGKLSTNADNFLLFNGKQIKPDIQGNNSLSLVGLFRVDDVDVVLVQDNGGTACPAFFQFVTVSASGATQSAGFGTCSDLIKTTQDGNTIVVTMPRMKGKGYAKYVFQKGVVKENGKVVK